MNILKEIATKYIDNSILYYMVFSICGMVVEILIQFLCLPLVLKFFELER